VQAAHVPEERHTTVVTADEVGTGTGRVDDPDEVATEERQRIGRAGWWIERSPVGREFSRPQPPVVGGEPEGGGGLLPSKPTIAAVYPPS